MAIVQLSRIQHRRGRKLAGTGMPQLASGELGWAIDTQELYIGNGSVSEGAPAVGNTKVLTEHDNLFDLAGQYNYRNGVIQGTFARPLQRRLDDFVSVRAFGAFGDGRDQTNELQTAVANLYKPSVNDLDDSEKVVLYIPEGTYVVTSPIFIPSYVTLVGAGKEKTVIKSSTSSIFETVTRGSLDPTLETQSKYIEISGMTLEVSNEEFPAIVLNSCSNSTFSNIRFKGVGSLTPNFVSSVKHCAIEFNSFSNSITCVHNVFENLEFDGFNSGLYADVYMAHNIVRNSFFKDLSIGVWFGTISSSVGPSFNTIENSVFDDIINEGILVNSGDYNTSKMNKFLKVGNNLGAQTQNITSVIRFETNTNVSDLDYFERTDLTKDQSALNNIYLPEVSGRTNYRNLYAHETSINLRTTFNSPEADLLKFPFLERGAIFVDYLYEYVPPTGAENTYILREGKIEIICNSTQNTVTLNDSYNFTGDLSVEAALQFRAIIVDTGVNEKVIVLQAINPNFNIVNPDKFYYTIQTKS